MALFSGWLPCLLPHVCPFWLLTFLAFACVFWLLLSNFGSHLYVLTSTCLFASHSLVLAPARLFWLLLTHFGSCTLSLNPAHLFWLLLFCYGICLALARPFWIKSISFRSCLSILAPALLSWLLLAHFGSPFSVLALSCPLWLLLFCFDLACLFLLTHQYGQKKRQAPLKQTLQLD